MMPLSCQCPSCSSRFKAPEKLAGKTVKCPKCGGALRVPDASSGAAGASDVLASQSAVGVTESASAARRKAVLKTRKVSEQKKAAPLPKATAPKIVTSSASGSQISSRVARRGRPSKNRQPKKSNRAALLAMTGIAAAVVLVLSAWVFLRPADDLGQPVVHHANRPTIDVKDAGPNAPARRPASTSANPSSTAGRSTPPAALPSGDISARAGESVLLLALPQEDRSNTRLDIDGRQQAVPSSGEVAFPLPPGQHHIVIRRRGYAQLDYRLFLRPGETFRVNPSWTKSDLAEAFAEASNRPTTDDWLQDFNAAKLKAAEENKDILLLFTGSDWCGYSQRLAGEVLLQADFRRVVDDKFVLVYLDFPRGAVSRSKVKDLQQNQALSQRFRIRGFPTFIVTDPQGLPYAALGYRAGGVATYQQQLEAARGVRDQRDKLFAQVESSQGPAKLFAAVQALRLIERFKLTGYYGETLGRWYDLARRHDPQNAQGLNEQIFEAYWKAQLAGLDGKDTAGIARLIRQFDQWCETCRFKDADRAAKLHLQAAWIAKDGHPELVEKYAAAGLAYGPSNDSLHDLLSQLKRAASQIGVLGSGSGFIIAEGGYILTNFHVVDGPGKLVVRLPDEEKPAPAWVIAEDPRRDLALIKIELPPGLQLAPLEFSPRHVDRGTRVAAFGYPLGDAVGKGLKLTTGIVSATDQQSDDRTLLLDCRVNPGNSGGPLCNTAGRVVGVVSAKSGASSEVDSYGMAISAEDAVLFLRQHISTFAHPDGEETPSQEWSEVDRRVSPSVLMILKIQG